MGRMKELATDPNKVSVLDIAMVKAHIFAMEYDPISGREVEKAGYHFIRDGYIEGFLAGVAHKFEQTDN